MRRLGKYSGLTTVLLVLCGCGIRTARLYELENSSAGTIAAALTVFESQHPGSQATNLSEIFAGSIALDRWHRAHPALYENRFLQFGKDAGFEHSFYEKYVFLPKGITNLSYRGQPMLMNARQFRNNDLREGRFVIWRGEGGDYGADWVDEARVQNAFRTSGLQIPAPSAAEKVQRPPGPPPRQRFDVGLFFKAIDRTLWLPLIIIFIAALGSLVFLTYWFGFRPSRKTEGPA